MPNPQDETKDRDPRKQIELWLERHKEDDDKYILNTFLTLGELRQIRNIMDWA